MQYSLYGENQSKTFYASSLYVEKERVMITDTQDYLDTDGCWEEYFIIKPELFQKLLDKLSSLYKPSTVEELDNNAKAVYDSLEDDTLKMLFLHIHHLAKCGPNRFHGLELVEKICGSDIPFEKSVYSKGP